MDVYAGIITTSRDARNNSYDAIRFGESLDRTHTNNFRDLLVRAELLASTTALRRMKAVRDAMNSDYHAARDDEERKRDVKYISHYGHGDPSWTEYEEWHHLRNGMVNALRDDLGIEKAELSFMRPLPATKWPPRSV